MPGQGEHTSVGEASSSWGGGSTTPAFNETFVHCFFAGLTISEKKRRIPVTNHGLKYPVRVYRAVVLVSPERQFIPCSVLGLHPSGLWQHLSPPCGDCSQVLLPLSWQALVMSSSTHHFFLYLALEGSQRKPSFSSCSPGSEGCQPVPAPTPGAED